MVARWVPSASKAWPMVRPRPSPKAWQVSSWRCHSLARTGRWNHMVWSRLTENQPCVPVGPPEPEGPADGESVGRVVGDVGEGEVVQQRVVGERHLHAEPAPGEAPARRCPGRSGARTGRSTSRWLGVVGAGMPGVGCTVWIVAAALGDVEAGLEVEDGADGLAGHDPAGAERAAVADAVDPRSGPARRRRRCG